MASAGVKQPIPAPADRLWALIADFGDTSWMPGGGGDVTLEGEGPGMARIIRAGDQQIREELVSVDPATRTLVYTIPEGVPFPVDGYRSTVVVTGDDSGSELEWRCEFEPAGVSEDEAVQMIQGMYGTMIGWVRDRVVDG